MVIGDWVYSFGPLLNSSEELIMYPERFGQTREEIPEYYQKDLDLVAAQ